MIIVHDLWKSYGELQVIKGMNLEIRDGETLVVLGRSGVGKSVRLRQIIGIERTDKGYVEVDNHRISGLRTAEREKFTKHMGMLFQGSALFDSMNVHDNVAFYLNQHQSSLSKTELEELVAEALELVDMAGTQYKMPSELSGGMRKRAALARLIIYRPKIMLYDEPTTGLDPITAMQINQLINKTREELKVTSIVVTHDILSAMEIGDRLAFFEDGVIQEIATRDEFLQIQNPSLQNFFHNAILSEDILNRSS